MSDFARLVQFQLYRDSAANEVLYALDVDGTLWRNCHPPTSDGWVAVPGPTIRQRRKEDQAIQHRYNIDRETI